MSGGRRKEKKREDGRYECQSIIAGGDVRISPRKPGENNPKDKSKDSKNNFTVSLGGGDECAPEYKTEVLDYKVADSTDDTGALLKKRCENQRRGDGFIQRLLWCTSFPVAAC